VISQSDGSWSTDHDNGPLSGVRVVDISSSYAAPTTTMYLADMGADVIKIEPLGGDDSRSWGPPFVGKESAWFLSANRNKRSLCLDITRQEGYQVLLQVLETADVFVENINPAKLEKLGLDPDTLRQRFPRLIYCAVSGFGLTGPDAGRPGYDLIAQARSGLMSVTGAKGHTPQRVSTALSDISAGTVAAFAVASALYRQQRTGQGDVIDVSLMETDLSLMAPRIASYLAGDVEPRPSGGSDSVLAVYQAFDTGDSPIVVAVGNDSMWQRFCTALELPDLADNLDFKTNERRRSQRDLLIERIAERLRGRTAAEWLALLTAASVPCSPIQFLSDVVNDPQVRARNAIGTQSHPKEGEFRVVNSPWRLASAPDAHATARPAPELGVDGLRILKETGYSDVEIEQLETQGVVWLAQDA
jgi:crotonobetainyl-CoA:carnitine CoA-transferase CaiB-like acyl-CoA transferase